MKRVKSILKTILLTSLMLPTLTVKASANDYSVTTRISGNTRVETSIEISEKFYADNSSLNVVLAGFNGEVDALTGTLLASSMNAPLLLVDHFKNIESELLRLGAKNVYLLGGETVISPLIEKDLQTAGYEVNRIDGEDRLETAVAVAREAVTNTDHVFLTNDGRTGSLVDALAVGPVSGMYLSPILLTSKDKLPAETLDALGEMDVSHIHIIGGKSTVSEEVENLLITEGFEVERIAGANRWQTAKMIADFYFSPGAAIVANDGYSGSLADALVSGHVGAKMHIPLLLTNANLLNTYTEQYLLESPHLRYVPGGENAISKKTFKDIVDTEGDTVNIDTEEQIQNAQYNFSYLDVIPKGQEVIAEFARNGKSVTTYKSVLAKNQLIEDIRVHTKWMVHPQNGLIYIGTNQNLTEQANPEISHGNLFSRSGWTSSDFNMQDGEIRGFSETGSNKAKNELHGLILVLPEKDDSGQTIHTIGKEAFNDYYFQRARMPDTIKNINAEAFKNVNLVHIEFPSQLEAIGNNAFSGNAFSNRVHFNHLQSLTEIGDEAFNYAFFGEGPYKINLESLQSLKSIGEGAFVGNQIQSVILPEGLKSIGPDAFIYNSIRQVTLPSSMIDLDEFAFDEDVLLIKD